MSSSFPFLFFIFRFLFSCFSFWEKQKEERRENGKCLPLSPFFFSFSVFCFPVLFSGKRKWNRKTAGMESSRHLPQLEAALRHFFYLARPRLSLTRSCLGLDFTASASAVPHSFCLGLGSVWYLIYFFMKLLCSVFH